MRVRKIKVYQMESGAMIKQVNDFIDEKMEEYENSGNYVVLDVDITSVNTSDYSSYHNRIVDYQSFVITFKLG